ncbi:MAG: hypothetical protein IPF99_41920 [Deltaproteobacteria bacterium]|nr:hypothetical protein [Deltaproteobacteria bacterium]MBK7067078.1 hypothetical protein [Deltaproteobacteria bacterium]
MPYRSVLPGVALCLAGLLGCSSASTTSADAATDASVPADVTASFTAMTSVSTLGQNCMPVVAADPLSLRGSITLTNTGTVPIGPVTLSAGLVIRVLGGETMATFAVTPVTLAAVAPGQSGTVAFAKTAGSLTGDAGVAGCEIVPCDSPIRIALRLTGPHLPEGARSFSEPMTMPCTH